MIISYGIQPHAIVHIGKVGKVVLNSECQLLKLCVLILGEIFSLEKYRKGRVVILLARADQY